MAKSYIIDDHFFQTKTSAEVYIRALVARYEDDVPVNDDDFGFVLDLLRLHPKDKIKCGIESICIASKPDFPTTRCFWLSYTDGTVDDVSWTKCLTPPTSERKFAYACRRAVAEQITNFRVVNYDNQLDPQYCLVNGELLLPGGVDVDHQAPHTFLAMTQQFITVNSIGVESVSYRDDGWFTDDKLSRAWSDFHAANCRLRLVSRKANRGILRRKVPLAVPIVQIPGSAQSI